MELNKKAAYLQGLVDGLGIDDTTKEGMIISALMALMILPSLVWALMIPPKRARSSRP